MFFLWKQGIHTHDKTRTTAIASHRRPIETRLPLRRPPTLDPPPATQRNARKKFPEKRILQQNSLAQHWARDWRALAPTQVHQRKKEDTVARPVIVGLLSSAFWKVFSLTKDGGNHGCCHRCIQPNIQHPCQLCHVYNVCVRCGEYNGIYVSYFMFIQTIDRTPGRPAETHCVRGDEKKISYLAVLTLVTVIGPLAPLVLRGLSSFFLKVYRGNAPSCARHRNVDRRRRYRMFALLATCSKSSSEK